MLQFLITVASNFICTNNKPICMVVGAVLMQNYTFGEYVGQIPKIQDIFSNYSTNTDGHIHAGTLIFMNHACNPTPISTSEKPAGTSSRLTKSPNMFCCRQAHSLPRSRLIIDEYVVYHKKLRQLNYGINLENCEHSC